MKNGHHNLIVGIHNKTAGLLPMALPASEAINEVCFVFRSFNLIFSCGI